MPIAWRLAAPKYARLLDGEGNRVTGARWNSPGRGVVYASGNLSLCILETYVHIPLRLRNRLPAFHYVCLEVPDDAGITEITMDQFKLLRSSTNPERASREVGDEWLRVGKDLVLVAPSVVVPDESNIMINPTHPRMKDVLIVNSGPFHFDSRLSAGRKKGPK